MLLQIKDVNVNYGGVKALMGISLDMEGGKIVSILGGNGAGKTSLANAICGLVTPNSGGIWFEGEKIDGLPPHAIVQRGIVQVPEGRGIFATLTVLENLKIGAYLNPSKQDIEKTLERVYRIFPLLRNKADQVGGSLSGGEQQVLAIGRGLMAKPRLLLLDEPTLGLSPMMRKEVGAVTEKINRTGTSVIFIEQDAQMALKIAHKGIVLQNGQVAMEGSCQELLNNPSLRENYLA